MADEQRTALPLQENEEHAETVPYRIPCLQVVAQ